MAIDATTKLNGYFPADFPDNNANGAERTNLSTESKVQLDKDSLPTYTVSDARVLQGETLTRENGGHLFQDKGFCAFPHETKVNDWNEDFMKGMLCGGMMKGAGTDISNLYAFEVEELIRNVLLPDYNVIETVCHNGVLKRGPESKNNFYGTGVHQDYGLTLEDYKNNVKSFDSTGYMTKQVENKWKNPNVKGIMVINFWRPILNYTKENPLLTKPLAVCDPSSVKTEDTVHTGLDAGSINGVAGVITDQMGLRSRGEHKWYYYPRMTNDEVLVFKQFEYWKTDSEDRTQIPVRGVFHTAFEDPNTPEGSPPRSSTEYRVTVYVGARKTQKQKTEPDFEIPKPLYPKTGAEWAQFMLGFGIIGVIVAGVTNKCPAIPDMQSYLISFGIVTILGDALKFHFNVKRSPIYGKKYPLPNAIASLLGVVQLALGIWGIALVFPNLNLFNGTSPDTCEMGALIAGTIPAAIICLVLVVLVFYGLYSMICRPKSTGVSEGVKEPLKVLTSAK